MNHGAHKARIQHLVDTLSFAKHSPSLRINTSSRLGRAVLDENQLDKFLEKARDLYTNAIKEGLEKTPLVIQDIDTESKEVGIINSGSVVEKFGRPQQYENLSVELQDDPEIVETKDPNHPKELLKSDHDLMFVLKDLVICSDLPNIANYRFEIAPTNKPGEAHFVRIYSVNQENSKLILKNKTANDHIANIVNNAFFVKKNIPTPLGTRLQQFVQRNILRRRCGRIPEEITDINIHQEGPSVNMKVTKTTDPTKILFECDFLLALPLEGWPQAANEWITRTRKWPPLEVVKELSKEKCYVIPKPKFPNDEEFWRISFSKQEVELARRLPVKARNVYLRLKLFFKQRIKYEYPEFKSYHLKTAFYWWMEEQDASIWEAVQPKREELLESLIHKLQFFIASGELPHYFIRTVNLHCMAPGISRIRFICHLANTSKSWIRRVRKKRNTVTVNSIYEDSYSIKFRRVSTKPKHAAERIIRPTSCPQRERSFSFIRMRERLETK